MEKICKVVRIKFGPGWHEQTGVTSVFEFDNMGAANTFVEEDVADMLDRWPELNANHYKRGPRSVFLADEKWDFGVAYCTIGNDE